mgnify:FL=1
MTIHTFFNVITFPDGDDAAAFQAWQAIGKFMEQQPGFLGSTLYRNRRNPKMLINKGRYESQEAFMECVQNKEFQRLSEVLTDLGVERTAGLYDEVEEFGQGGN